MPEHAERAESRVCTQCFADPAIKRFVAAHATEVGCDYCGIASDGLATAKFDAVLGLIATSIDAEWGDANALLPRDDETGALIRHVPVYGTRELVEDVIGLDLPNDHSRRLCNDIVGALRDCDWCHSKDFSTGSSEAITTSWRIFRDIAKHERRFFFMQHRSDRLFERVMDEEAAYDPADILEKVCAYCERAGMFTIMTAGANFTRCQAKDRTEPTFDARRMGPAPRALANQSNRMSPAGIPMFYGALEDETALAETTTVAGHFAVGTFATLRDVLLLDLRNAPETPSFFDTARAGDRKWAGFMRGFLDKFKTPIARDGQEHVEYVPTQVVTEYLRTLAKPAGRMVDGVLYSSTRRPAGTAAVLFADTFTVAASSETQMERLRRRLERDAHDEPWLSMVGYREVDFDPAA